MSEPEREEGPPRAAPKEDPETFILRASPRPVVRFRRGLIIGITGAVAASVIAVTWFALDPPSFRSAAREEGADPLRKAPLDVLAGAPSSYGDVPRLGRPLPGDLGRPILEYERRLADSASPPVPAAIDTEAERAKAAAEAERQRLAAAREAARASSVIVQLAGGAAPPVPSAVDPLSASPGDRPQVSPGGGAGEPQRTRGPSGPDPDELNPHALRAAASPWMLIAGTIIPASLITGLNSDLPGTVVAQVTENVRDSATGRSVMVPQGARLIGSYDSRVSYGQSRALLVWQRIIFPDGASIALDNAPATDLAGYSGLQDDVDLHSWRLLKGIALSTLLGVGTQLSLGSAETDLVRAVRESAQQNATRAGEQITTRNLDLQPTLTVRPGWPVRAVLHKDIILRPWKG